LDEGLALIVEQSSAMVCHRTQARGKCEGLAIAAASFIFGGKWNNRAE